MLSGGARAWSAALFREKDRAVIGDQHRAFVDQPQRQVGFAGAALAQQQHAVAAQRHTTGMDVGLIHGAAATGSSTTRRAPALAVSGVAVLGIDAAARAFDDLAGDGQAQARIRPKCLARPLGVRSARKWIPDCQAECRGLHPPLSPARTMSCLRARDDHLAAFGAEGHRHCRSGCGTPGPAFRRGRITVAPAGSSSCST